jgi:uncharacterized RDD family membrane protein YckC
MLCPKCGIDVGNSLALCEKCKELEPVKEIESEESIRKEAFEESSWGSGVAPETYSNGEVVYAGFWLRAFALLLDSWIISAVVCALLFLGVISLSVVSFFSFEGGVATYIMLMVGATLLLMLYYPIMESSRLQATLGKLAFGIYVSKSDGTKLSFLRSLGRNLSKILSSIPLYLGFLPAAFSSRKQALHDMFADCVVARRPNISFGRRLCWALVAIFGSSVLGAAQTGIGNLIGAKRIGNSTVIDLSNYKFTSSKSQLITPSPIVSKSEILTAPKTLPDNLKPEALPTESKQVAPDTIIEAPAPEAINNETTEEKAPNFALPDELSSGQLAAVALDGEVVNLEEVVALYHSKYRRLEIGFYPAKVSESQLETLKQKRAISTVGLNAPRLVINLGFKSQHEFKRDAVALYNLTFFVSSLSVFSTTTAGHTGYIEIDKTYTEKDGIVSLKGSSARLSKLKIHDKGKTAKGTDLEWRVELSNIPVFEIN